MNKKVQYAALYGVYGKLLTKRQAQITELYYGCDLSLNEVAEIIGVTRQSVSVALKTVREELDGFEERLKIMQLRTKLLEFSKKLGGELLNELNCILEE